MKEAQVRALREARFAKRKMLRVGKVEIEAPDTKTVTPDTKTVTPRFSHEVTQSLLTEENRKLMAQIIHYEAEIKTLKTELATRKPLAMTAAERTRKKRQLAKAHEHDPK